MQLTYGTYTHADNEVTLTISSRPVYERGVKVKVTVTWTIDGKLQADDAAGLSLAIAALEAGYASNGQNLSLGGTAHSLLSSECIGGTRVTELSYPTGDGAEYVTFRSYRITVEGDLAVTNTTTVITEFTESISLSGGGPKWVMLTPANGPPQRQQTRGQMPYVARQSGSAIGFGQYPAVPDPIWPSAEHRERRQITRSSPKVTAGAAQYYPVQWSYEFESATSLIGSPTIR